MKTITILGATGSIGKSTLQVIRENSGDFKVFALCAHQNIELLYKQCLEFVPEYAVVANEVLAQKLSQKLTGKGVEVKVLYGVDALVKVASDDTVDVVMAAIVGIAGLKPTYAAVESGKKILLANKEALVTAGHLFMQAVEKYQATLLPVDSEHNAIYQCLLENKQNQDKTIDKIIITASGGPFRQRTLQELKGITPDEACAHPNWKMGRKISIDSSTMVNKALEVIEAYWLFDVTVEKIQVLIHPQSIVHSMVAYCDGSYIAQLGSPDMKTPIAYAMYYPERRAVNVPKLDLTAKPLEFYPVDGERFGVMPLVFNLLACKDHTGMIVFNAANEVLVDAFLAEKISYLQIIQYIIQTIEDLSFERARNIDEVIDVDRQTRRYVEQIINDSSLNKCNQYN